MSTTTSTENSGLLSVLLPPFEKKYDCKVDVVAVGTGKALKLGEAGDVDVVFVHARTLEDKFVANRASGSNRRDVMYNDFVLLGPKDDPAGVGKGEERAGRLPRDRGEGEPVHLAGGRIGDPREGEGDLGGRRDRPPGRMVHRGGTGDGGGDHDGDRRSVDTPSPTAGRTSPSGRRPTSSWCCRGIRDLWNPYGIIAVNPKKHKHVKYDLAMKLIDFVTGPEGQSIIAGYKIDGEPLFFVYGKGVKH